jgi:thioredoxin-related protein
MTTFKASLTIALTLVLAAAVTAVEKGDKGKKDSDPKATTNNEIDWHDYDDGLVLAKKTDRHVFIDFTAKWCGWCNKMDKETFADQTVIKILNNDFVPVKVDGDSEKTLDVDGFKITEKNLARAEFRIRGYPAFWFLKPDGTKLGMLPGYQTTANLTKALEYIRDYQYDSTHAKPRSGK